eukprot:6472170-Amphidinium_carterae.1
MAVRVLSESCVITVMVAHVYGRDDSEWQCVLNAIAEFHALFPLDCHMLLCDSNVVLEKCDRQVRSEGTYS